VNAPGKAGRLRSLRWRLVAAVGAGVLLTWLLTGWSSYTMARHEAKELMDGSLAQTGHLLLAMMQGEGDALADLATRLELVRGAVDNIYEPPLEFQLGRGDGSILARSADAPELPILGRAGYSDIIRHAESWRVLNIISVDDRYRVQVSQPISLRDRAALEVASQTVLPLLVIVPVLILLIYLSVRGGLRPLDRLASQVAARTPDNLGPLSENGVPTEARPLVNSINRLFSRVRDALENERRFTADAAHEMRTPLAALKVQTQVARLSTETAMRDKALRQIESGVDRAGHLLEQLLRLARLDPVVSLETTQSVALGRLLREVLEEVLLVHPGARREISVAPAADAAAVLGDPELLRIAVRNLLDNALRYTRDGDTLRIAVEQAGETISVAVHDSGPGVPESQLGKLCERFWRGREDGGRPAAQRAVGGREGSGLGLAIVARVAELHGARLQLENAPAGGFIARIDGLAAAL